VTGHAPALHDLGGRRTIAPMREKSGPLHQPLPPLLVDALVRAGVSHETAASMERWKAQEILELLSVPRHLIVRRGDAPGSVS
jgi:hypothetical protein